MTASLVPAAQYLRRSTERQQYSLANQADCIRRYAQLHGFIIVKTYSEDSTGMAIKHRDGLRQLIQDIVTDPGPPAFRAVIVYDVSRWGRFPDIDESAYYEFLCKRAGVPVHVAKAAGGDPKSTQLLMNVLKPTESDRNETQKRLYSGFFYKRFIEGLWVIAEGAIYKDSWSEELLYDLKDEPKWLRLPGGHQQRTVAVDYGTTNPMVFLDIYDDGELIWVAREYYWDSVAEMRQKTDAEYADDLVEFIGPRGDAKVIIDPSAASFKAEMTKRGIWHADADDSTR